ncbi:pantoate--beta-alanine ligase [Erwinia sorbitola]|uniref:Adenylyltransferase/cytidyltransferase family protein n=1 Tax=Erwinia sorbitola TaxID=2681984 RepID=A0A6I6EF99_9GAMM|nr:pantoate--beta-alanine ligase [Erwinia sorbitola]MTD26964.1 adenylyltransferase/cytidyltransferase family protein [Erwinia sorbitola]QGU88527.1 adenylyltransferase/cytidyltransferase family protein [Erwinia sorbitola]
MKTVITFGTFDIFHIGHLNILRRASEMGDRLVVGISSDRLNFNKKQRHPVYPQQQRMAIVSQIKGVDEVFLEESLEKKAEYIRQFSASVLVMGDDWAGRFDHLQTLCKVCYLPRTPSISTTSIIEVTRSQII